MPDNIQLEHKHHSSDPSSDTSSDQGIHQLCFLLYDIESPVNVGSIFRIADALGVEKMYLCGKTISPPNTKLRKASRVTEKYVSYEVFDDPMYVVTTLKTQGYHIVSLEITSASCDIRDLSVPTGGKLCLILGSEKYGVSQELLDVSDATVHIPMRGENSSMNVAVASAIAAFSLLG